MGKIMVCLCGMWMFFAESEWILFIFGSLYLNFMRVELLSDFWCEGMWLRKEK